jgi:Tol biopolymer transport system component
MGGMERFRSGASWVLVVVLVGCAQSDSTPQPSSSAAASASGTVSALPQPTRIVHRSQTAVSLGEPIDLASLAGRIVTDDFADVLAMDVDGSQVVTIAGDPAGPEFDGAWSPDGEWIVYRDSTRGINEDDEIYIVRSDGTDRRNLTKNPANDWGPDWSPDGTTIVFNSDREQDGALHGYLVNPDGTHLRRIDVEVWFEYPSFSPDGTKIVFMGARGNNYDIYTADLATGTVSRLTDHPGDDGWPVFSPDGSTIAFTSIRDDCGYASLDQECWDTGDTGPHHDIWLIDSDGSNLRRVTPEFGQFVAWSPDGQYLLISGYALYVVRPDGTGRLELRANGIPTPLGGIPDWR